MTLSSGYTDQPPGGGDPGRGGIGVGVGEGAEEGTGAPVAGAAGAVGRARSGRTGGGFSRGSGGPPEASDAAFAMIAVPPTVPNPFRNCLRVVIRHLSNG